MKKIFTFLVAFLTTVSGAVWGQTGSGTEKDPWIINLENPQEIHNGLLGANEVVTLESGNAIEIHEDGHFKVVGTTSTYHINIGHESAGVAYSGPRGEDEMVYLIFDGVNINTESPLWFGEPKLSGEENEVYVSIELRGENILNGNGSPAIEVNGNSNLFISGTGSLYAIGTVGIGNPSGVVGNIEITGGTVVASGTAGIGIGGSDDNGTDVHIHGNTFVVSNGTGNVIENFESGIFYDSSDGDNTADVKGTVTLDSSYPSADEILGSKLKFDILDGSTLTLGEGISFPTTRLANATDEDKLKAYKVTYDLNKSVGENEDIQITNEADYVAIYAGANVDLATLPEDSRTDIPSWQAMAWGQNNGGTYAKVTKTGSTTPSTAVTNNQINATAIWAVDTWTNINVPQGKPISGNIQLFYPQEAASLFNITNGSDLNQYGAALGSGDSQNKVVAHTAGATAAVSETATNVSLTIEGEDKTITLPFIVNADTPNLTDATLTTKMVEYDSNSVERGDILATFTYKGGPITWSDELFDLQFKADNENQAGTVLDSAPEDVGKYWVSIKAKEGNGSYQGETDYVQFEITPKSVTVKSVADEVYTINGDETFDWFDNVTLEGLFEGDDVTIKYNGIPDGSDYVDTPGTYNVSYTILSKEGDDAGNYTIPESTTGKLIVKKTGNNDDPIKPGDPNDPDTEIKIDDGEGGWEWRDDLNGYYRTYDAESHPLNVANTIYVKQKDAEGEDWVAVPADAISVSYTFTEEQTENNQDPYTGAIKDAGDYVASITIDSDKLGESGVLYSGEADDIKLFILPFDLNIAIKQLDASFIGKTTNNITADLVTVTETLPKEEVPSYSGSIKVSEDANENGTYGVTFTDIKLVDAEGFNASNYNAKFTYNGKALSEVTETEIPDITPGDDTDIDDGDGDDNNWTWNGKEYEVIYDGNEHGIASITVSGAEATIVTITYSDEEGVKLEDNEKPLNAGHYTAEVVVKVGETSKSGEIPLWIKQRPLGVHFNLDDYILEAGGEYDAIDVAEYEPVEVEENVWVGGELKSEEPVLEGKIKVADTPNSEDKYAVTFEGVKLGTEGNFDADNYEPTYYLNGELIKLDENGNGTSGGDDDPEQGIDISEPDDETGISGIGTKRYRLYLANKDYNVVDAKADYAAEGLELFSRHDKKYTKVGGSFTVWYEKDGVANAGGYRIFWSNRANGDYKEVKFDTVSEYFQIRNVQSNVYVKIYAADGFPVGNEEISAADYRAYAQPNKIVVITPQPTDVQIISMAGAVVATDKVTGQREFTNLTEGVYIVRMGETVVKLQVRK